MPNIIKPSVVGIDIKIQQLQTFIYTKLLTLWGLTDLTYNAYGRAYRNQMEQGYVPQVYVAKNEYKEVYWNSTVSASSFFGVGEDISTTNKAVTADVFLIFIVNLNLIKPGVTRNDEEAHIDVQKLVTRFINGFTFIGLKTGIDQVFKDYPGWLKNNQAMPMDMHPLHCFRLNFKLLYNPFLNCQQG